jgi:hypothetical protein
MALGTLPGRVMTLVLARVWFLVGLGIVAGTESVCGHPVSSVA